LLKTPGNRKGVCCEEKNREYIPEGMEIDKDDTQGHVEIRGLEKTGYYEKCRVNPENENEKMWEAVTGKRVDSKSWLMLRSSGELICSGIEGRGGLHCLSGDEIRRAYEASHLR
jgi:hypothetical protein